MNIPDLEAFVAVVDAGSVVGASAKLNLTQPAVTRRVQSLERSLGEELLDRNSKPQKPTASGRTAYTLARRILATADDLRHAMTAGGNVSGEFRFGASHSLTDLALVEAVGRLRTSFPRLSLHTSTDWSDKLVQNLESGHLDAAAVTAVDGKYIFPGLISERVGQVAAFVVAAKASDIGSKATLEEVAAKSWVLNNEGCSLRCLVGDLMQQRHFPFQVATEAAGAELQLAFVARGVGLGIVSEPMLLRSRHRSNVKIVNVREIRARVNVCLVSRQPSGRLAEPIRLLKTVFAESLAIKPKRRAT